MNNLMHESVKIAERPFFNTAHSLIKALEELVALTPESDAIIVDVAIAPHGPNSELAGITDKAHLYEETLSDGSKVYNIEIY